MISRKCGPWQDAAVRRQFSSLNLPLFGNLLIERLGVRARRDFLQRVKLGDLLLGDASQPLRDIGVRRKPPNRVLVQLRIQSPQ